jgi:Tfp pilus assembly protein PilN
LEVALVALEVRVEPVRFRSPMVAMGAQVVEAVMEALVLVAVRAEQVGPQVPTATLQVAILEMAALQGLARGMVLMVMACLGVVATA